MKFTRVTFVGRIPSLKQARRIIKIRGHLALVPSIAWNRYEKEVLRTMPKPDKPIPGPYEIHYAINLKGKGFQDIDNIVAGINDLLQKLNYLEDDRYIYKMTADKIVGAKEYEALVEIHHIPNVTKI